MADDERKVCGACEMPIADGASWISHGAAGPPYHRHTSGCIDALRTTLARLTANLAAVTAERDMWRGECASISAELDLPPGMRPMEGELRRMLGHNRALLAERDEARGLLDAADTTRREWEVRAATSYRDGRAAGLREAAAKLAELRDEWEVMMGDGSVAHNCGKIAHGHVIALAPPAAEPRDEGEVSDE